MYEKLEKCPVCKNKLFDNYMICTDYSVSGESFALVKCQSCKLVFTNPRPSEKNLSKYYKSDQYISHTDKGNSLLNIVYKLVRKYTLSKKNALITSVNSRTGVLLDYGCGTGDFVKTASNKGWQAFGFEPNNDAKSIAVKKNKDFILNKISDTKSDFDIITAWHVVEHISDLRKTVKTLIGKLKKDGHLIVAVPNHKSYDAQYYKEHWAAYDLPRHLYHFDQDSMTYLVESLKAKVVDIKPMIFDSYYVSLLSEKYLKKNSFLNAFKIGFLSNRKAKITSEYSSLIYIIRK